MNTPDPGRQHPLYWCLNTLLGVSRSQIADDTNLSQHTITRLIDGAPVTRHVTRRLITFLEQQRDLWGNQQSQHTTPTINAYRRAVFAVINEVIDHHRVPLRVERDTDLRKLIRANLTQSPQHDAVIISKLHPPYAISSLRRAAKRMGVVIERIDHRVTWRLP
jgi:plasmid maintenance system antidote protein VapI